MEETQRDNRRGKDRGGTEGEIVGRDRREKQKR
jgi:hypothetical protein